MLRRTILALGPTIPRLVRAAEVIQ